MPSDREHPDDGRPVRHILSLSGGKDSTALAIYLKDRIPNLEYVFADTGEELNETYEYLERLEAFIGSPITRLNPDRQFDYYLKIYRGVLPDARTRWCTRKLKIEPFERFVGNDLAYTYVGIRADESYRKGYISTKPNIIPRYPFIDNGLVKSDVLRILDDSGLGLPNYYEWRSRSGCYFCFFQRKIEWVGLYEQHPDLFESAMGYETEKENVATGERYTWSEGESLRELVQPDRIEKIKADFERRNQSLNEQPKPNQPLREVFSFVEDDDDDGCLICHL